MGYTVSANEQTLQEKWYVVDAKDQVLGRLASDIAAVLRGKHMPTFTPHVNMKTHVIVVNAECVRLTGDKMKTKKYYRHSGWVGGIKETTAEKLNARKPGELVRMAVQGMLPHNRLGDATMTRLRIFAGPSHDHAAQKPEPLPARTAAA
jgi:large subunit ribosomal protein L13